MNGLREIDGFPDYFVNKRGDVFSRKSGKLVKKKPSRVSLGYLAVGLYSKEKECILRSVHSLVLGAFIKKPGKNYEVRHLNGNKTDNRLINLKWGTPKENAADMVLHGTASRGDRHGCRKVSSSDVIEIRLLKSAGAKRKELAKKYNLNVATIDKIVSGRSWSHIQLKTRESLEDEK